MREVMRVTADRRTLYVRLPRLWAEAQGVSRGSFLVVTEIAGGALVVRKFGDEVKNLAKTGGG